MNDIHLRSPCKCCLQSVFTHYISLLDMDKLIKTRAKAQANKSCEIASIEMPRILGAKGHVNYVYDFTTGNKP